MLWKGKDCVECGQVFDVMAIALLRLMNRRASFLKQGAAINVAAEMKAGLYVAMFCSSVSCFTRGKSHKFSRMLFETSIMCIDYSNCQSSIGWHKRIFRGKTRQKHRCMHMNVHWTGQFYRLKILGVGIFVKYIDQILAKHNVMHVRRRRS